MKNKNVKTSSQGMSSFIAQLIFLQILFSGLAWLIGVSELRTFLAVAELSICLISALLFVYFNIKHMRAVYAHIVVIIQALVLAFPLIRLGLNLILINAPNYILLSVITIFTFILEWIVSYYYYLDKFKAIKEKNQKTERFNITSGHWNLAKRLDVGENPGQNPNNGSWLNLARFILPLGITLGLLISRMPNAQLSNQIIGGLTLILACIFIALTGMHSAIIQLIIGIEKSINKQIKLFWE